MQETDLTKLEYFKILDLLSHYAKTKPGKERCLQLRPTSDVATAQTLLEETSEGVSLIVRIGKPPLASFSEINLCLKKLQSEITLSVKELLDVVQVLKIARELKSYFLSQEEIELSSYPILSNLFSTLYTNSNLEKEITSKILDEFTIDDHASEKLYQIRKEKRKLEQEIKEKLNQYIHSSTYSKYIQENVIMIRNDRYVIPVKEEYRSSIKGFIHDISSSGSTVFIEPTSIFDWNNKVNELKLEETLEIEKILERLSSLFFPIVEELEQNLSIVGSIDFIFAKASYSIELDATAPKQNEEKKIELIQARHPLIPKEKVVPISLELGIDYSTLVITGPNTGGKTVALKTVGLLCSMAASGLHIPAKDNSSIYIFDAIYADIGDEQSIQESLSTFSSHMLNIIHILNHSTSSSLILVDELGSGTDPVEGSSLAISILEEFYEKNALVIATTHYPEIKNYALTHSGFENASCEFDVENLAPTYRFLIGIPGKSNAFAISKRLGLTDTIIKRASSFLSSDQIGMEEVLKQIYDDKIQIEKAKEEIQKNQTQIEQLRKSLEKKVSQVQEAESDKIEKAKEEARNILLKAKEQASDAIRQISHSSMDHKELNTMRNQLNENIKSLAPSLSTSSTESFLKEEDLKIGMPIFIRRFGQDATLLTLPNKEKEVQVQMGAMKTVVSIHEISPSGKPQNKKEVRKGVSSTSMKSKHISSEINLIGQNIEEAIFVLDKFLDDCSVSHLSPIRIVHGKGTGKLRQGIHTYLKKHSQVKTFRIGTFGEGEMGVTIVELK